MNKPPNTETIYLAGGCLWGVQEYIRHLPGVVATQAGRANGSSDNTQSDYDGYTECVRTEFDSEHLTLQQLLDYFFEIIAPYSVNKQGDDIGEKYLTGIYSKHKHQLIQAGEYISSRSDAEKVVVEVLPLSNYVRSDDEHQDRLTRCPDDYCHIPQSLLHKYKAEDN